MTINSTPNKPDNFSILSSIADDVWRGATAPEAYEWWYFDAVSESGRDLLVIIFLTNFVFSPRYNRQASDSSKEISQPGALPVKQIPAIAFTLYRDGRPVLRSISEHTAAEFFASSEHPACRIGASNFHFVPHSEGGTYHIEINAPLRRGRTLAARFTWRIVAGDLRTPCVADTPSSATHEWNMVAPRCAVAGEWTITKRDGASEPHEFRGTGYHDHNRDNRFLPATIAEWQWGRAHFRNSTVIYYRYREHEPTFITRLLTVENDELKIYMPLYTGDRVRRHHFGLRYTRQLGFATADADTNEQLTLHADQSRVVDGSFFYLRFAGTANLHRGNNQTPETAPLISEHLAPRALRWRWLDWLTNMRISRRNRPSFLP